MAMISREPSGAWLQALTTKSRGLVDLRATHDLCDKRTKTRFCEVTYRFDGRVYHAAKWKPLPGFRSLGP